MANYSPHLDNVFSALADPTRRAIIARLSQGEASVGELAQPFVLDLKPRHRQPLAVFDQQLHLETLRQILTKK